MKSSINIENLKKLDLINNCIKLMPYKSFTVVEQKTKFLLLGKTESSICRIHIIKDDFVLNSGIEEALLMFPMNIFKITSTLKKFSTFLNKKTDKFKKTLHSSYLFDNEFKLTFTDLEVDKFYSEYVNELNVEASKKAKTKKSISDEELFGDEEPEKDDSEDDEEELLVADIRNIPLFSFIPKPKTSLPSILKPNDEIIEEVENWEYSSIELKELIQEGKETAIQQVTGTRILHKHLPNLSKIDSLKIQSTSTDSISIFQFVSPISKVEALVEIYKVAVKNF
jgi:hypothetical protein